MQLKRNMVLVIMLGAASMGLASAQTDIVDIGGPKYLQATSNLPTNLLASKSIFIYNPLKDAALLREGWKQNGITAHETFRKSGIDVVAYYHLHDILAGAAASSSIISSLAERGISNLIVLNHEIDGRQGTEEFKLIITPFNQKTSLVEQGQSAYVIEGAALDVVLLQLYRRSAKGLERKSLLIAETPEFFEDAMLISGQRYEKFPTDLRVLKIAVRRQDKIAVPENASQMLMAQLQKENLAIDKRNQRLQEIVETFPLKYEWANGSDSEEDLRSKGVQFVLLHLNTTGEVIKRMLNYNMSHDESSYVSTIYQGDQQITRNYPADQPVHKYYVKHIVTGDVYLGRPWDADLTWQGSLNNFMTNLKKELKLNP